MKFFASCFTIGKAWLPHGWGTFQKCKFELGYGLVLSNLPPYFENALTLGLYPTQIDWGMHLLYIQEGLQMIVLSPKRGGNNFVMALPSKFYVDSPSFVEYFQGIEMRLQQVFVINWKSFYLKNFTIQKQGPQGIRPLLISSHRTN